jgi:peptide/nickel transport system ATP-binding protein
MSTSAKPLLQIRDLYVSFRSSEGQTDAVKNVSFDVGAGEIVGIVGESGSGKSVTCRAILGLLPQSATVSGSINLMGQELLGLDEASLAEVRGRQVSMIFQNPSSHLDPLMKIGRQVSEPLVHHMDVSARSARQAAITALEEVKLDRADQRVDNYPHQLSGGMKQRAMIASAVACQPKLLLADEPTTALDVTVQASILELLTELNQAKNLSIVLVSHDLAVVAQICHRVVVMRRGEVVEQSSAKEIIHSPQHAYTRQLIDSQPDRLAAALTAELTHVNTAAEESAAAAEHPLLGIEQLTVEFKLPGAGFKLWGKPENDKTIRAIDRVSLELREGEVLGIVGESGSGKSTLARVIMGLVEPLSGAVMLRGSPLPGSEEKSPEDFRRTVQMAFQNPFDSLNPRFTVRQTIAEPIRKHKLVPAEKLNQRVTELMQLVGLETELADRKPRQLSGGQCQRVGIARALAMNPEVLIADEVTSALDVTIQAQIIDLLNELRSKVNLSVIFISHDLALVRSFCDRVAVFKAGRIVEMGKIEDVLECPQEEYTKQLIASAPVM